MRLLLVMAPAERWLGTGRLLLAVAAGHVGATLVTVSGIAYGIDAGGLGQGSPPSATSAMGFFAVVAVLTHRIPRPKLRDLDCWQWP